MRTIERGWMGPFEFDNMGNAAGIRRAEGMRDCLFDSFLTSLISRLDGPTPSPGKGILRPHIKVMVHLSVQTT